MLDELFGLSGEVAVVTGAGRGIGEGIAKVLAGAGASVVCAARRTEEIERVASEIVAANGKAIAVTTDVTDDAALRRTAEAARSEFGRLDIWVNITAIWTSSCIAAELMEDGGRILNISSLAAEQVIPGSGHYSAAKAGVNMLTRTFAKELGPRIRVNCIMPGAVPTEIMMKAMKLTEDDLPNLERMLQLPAGRLGTPQDLGAATLFLCSKASEWITGQCINVSGGP